MDFSQDQLEELHKILKSVNITDDYLSRGVRLTHVGINKIANHFGITTNDVPDMLQAVSAMVAKNINEDSRRYTYEADYMGNLTLRDAQTGNDRYLQGDDAFALASKLEQNPDKEEMLISPYFDNKPLSEDVMPEIHSNGGGTFNFPYKGKFATAVFSRKNDEPEIKVISLRDSEDNEFDITPELQTELNAIAWKWVDKV